MAADTQIAPLPAGAAYDRAEDRRVVLKDPMQPPAAPEINVPTLPAGAMLAADFEQQNNPLANIMPEGALTADKELIKNVAQGTGEYVDRLDAARQGRKDEVEKAIQSYRNNNLSEGSLLLQLAGKGLAGNAVDLVGETVNTALSAVTPDQIEEPIKLWAQQAFGAAYNSDVGQSMAKAWKSLSPEAQANAQSAGNILAVLTPKLKLSKAGKKIKGMGSALKRERLASTTLKLPDTAKNREIEANRAFTEDFNYQAVVDEMAKIQSISPNKSYKQNIIAVNAAIAEIDLGLMRELRKNNAGAKEITQEFIDEKLDFRLNQVLTDERSLINDADISRSVDQYVLKARELMDARPKTPAGVLHARRTFDKFIKDKDFQTTAYDLTARGLVQKALRNAMNDIAGEAAPSNVPLKKILDTESKLFMGWSNLTDNYIQSSDFLETAVRYAKRHPSLAVAGAGMGAGLASSIYAPALATGLAAAGVYRYTPKVLEKTGSAIEKSAKVTDNVPLPFARAGAITAANEDDSAVIPQETYK